MFRLLRFSFLFFFLHFSAEARETICLNMIVKDESHVIKRCLKTIKPLIDYWVIVDTGSTDGTQEIIREYMKDIPGELHERPWVNFGHNRTEALELAKDKAHYLLFIDADEQFLYAEDFTFPPLDKDFYYVVTEYSYLRYHRINLVSTRLDWKWIGVLHEYLDAPGITSFATLENIVDFVSPDGNRSQDPFKFYKDALILERAVRENPDNARYIFYLAQTYKGLGEYQSAIDYYRKRIEMGGWNQEIFWSLYQIALSQEALGEDPSIFIQSYWNAFRYRPGRVEPLYRMAFYLRQQEEYESGYQIAKLGLKIPPTKDTLFSEHWISDWGLLLEFSICAYWVGEFEEAEKACYDLLANPNILPAVRECAEKNLEWVYTQIPRS